MTRVTAAVAVLCALLTVTALRVETRSDAEAILGPVIQGTVKIESANDRQLIIALASDDLATRNAAAHSLAKWLSDQSLVHRVDTGPAAPSPAFLDWIWEKRFRLSPPSPTDLTVANLSRRLEQARAALAQGSGMLIGDRLLRDPTGSFASLVERMRASPVGLGQQGGIWQSRDDSAALMFVTLADRPFQAAETAEFARSIRAHAKDLEVQVYLLGPRVIAAEISTQISEAASVSAIVATALLLAWLAWILRSGRLLAITFLPLALGVASATLVVQIAFGSVHVVALGFGGALTGLALDYPLHLLSHESETRQQTERLMLIGAITTAVGFLALFGSDIPALMQTGLFIATGLAVAAVASKLIIPNAASELRAPPMERLAWRLRGKGWVETFLLFAGVAVVLASPAQSVRALFEPPEQVDAVIAKFAAMLTLPSERHVITVTGKSFGELLEREAALRPILDAAIDRRTLGSYGMLARYLPAPQQNPFSGLPLPDEYRRLAMDALRANGMVLDFAAQQTEDYKFALSTPGIGPDDLDAFQETRIVAANLKHDQAGWHDRIPLFELKDPEAVSAAINSADLAGVEMFDLRNRIDSALAQLRQRVAGWLGLGALVAFAVLAIGLRNWRRAVWIVRTTATATAITAAVLTLSGGTLGIFQIVALTLIVGIGIDYGLFLSGPGRDEDNRSRYRSVALCAGSTFVAFTIMGLTSVRILQEVGLTVSVGVVVMVILNLARPERMEGGQP